MTEVAIFDYETDEEVGTLTEDGELHTDDEALADIAREMSEEGGVSVMTTGGSDMAIAYGDWTITPEDEGFRLAFIEYLPSPYTVSAETLRSLPQYKPPGEEEPHVEPEPEEKAASSLADAVLDKFGWNAPGTDETVQKDCLGLSAEEYEDCDDRLREMHKRLAEWDGDDLSKAPPAWDSNDDVPEYVVEAVEEAIEEEDVVWDKFEGYSRQSAVAVQNSLEEDLTQPQGWSIGSIVDDLQEMFPGMDEEKATNIARTEVSAILNSAREEAYESREDSVDYVYYWQGPADHRRTKVCEEIAEEVEARGGAVPMHELRSILLNKAKKYEGTREGGTPERVDEWTPHYMCRHTFIRDVKAVL